MKKFIKDHQFLAGVSSIFICVFLVSIVAYGATTIGTNIETAGTATMESASTTNDFWLGNVIADDDDYLYMDASGTQYMMWDDSPGQFVFSNNIQITGEASTTEYISIGGDAGNDDDVLHFDAREENLTWDNTNAKFTLSDDLDITGWASTTVSLNTQGTLHAGSNVTIGGMTTTTDYIYLPTIHFEQGIATSANPVVGECFMPNNNLHCWDGAAWQSAW